MRKLLFILPFAACLFTFAACSIPNLESNECQQARDPLQQFYSYHFGNDMQPSEKYYKDRKDYLTASFGNFVSKQITNKRDFFTLEEDYPKAFRVGSCKTIAPDRAEFGVLLFWKTDTRSEQREIKVEVVKENEKWLIDKVSKANK